MTIRIKYKMPQSRRRKKRKLIEDDYDSDDSDTYLPIALRKRKKNKFKINGYGSDDCVPYLPFLPRKSFKLEDDSCKCTLRNDENYNMNHKKRGRAIVFNHYLCHGHAHPRRGTECDVMRLGRTLSNILHFEVRVYTDLKHCEILDVLHKLSNENFCQDDCLAVFVLTHGALHGLTAADESYGVEELWRNFIPTKCNSLAGKPKLFFINSCRGTKFDEGYIYENREAEAPNNEASQTKTVSYRAPIYADFLTFYSTMEGYTSLRHPAHGTWFIQSLCETLENKNYKKMELKQILTVTTRKTAFKCNDYSERVCQIPTMMSTLTRNVFFE